MAMPYFAGWQYIVLTGKGLFDSKLNGHPQYIVVMHYISSGSDTVEMDRLLTKPLNSF